MESAYDPASSESAEIVEVYQKADRQDTGVAIIQNGSLRNENLAIGTIDTIVEIARKEKIGTPAIIVIGDVVKEHADFPSSLSGWQYLLS